MAVELHADDVNGAFLANSLGYTSHSTVVIAFSTLLRCVTSLLIVIASRIKSGQDAMAIPGVGKKIGAKIDEFLSTGQLAKLDKIAANPIAQAIQLFTSVVGIGPAAAAVYAGKVGEKGGILLRTYVEVVW